MDNCSEKEATEKARVLYKFTKPYFNYTVYNLIYCVFYKVIHPITLLSEVSQSSLSFSGISLKSFVFSLFSESLFKCTH
jgi:hypothetical protein